MPKVISFSALSLLFVACSSKTAPVEATAAEEVEAEATAEAPAAEPTSSVTAAADVQWMPANPEMPEGPQLAVIEGNMKEGAFSALVKLPAGHASPLHSHPAGFSGVVVSGTVHNGRTADDYIEIGVGSTWTEPANEVHFTGCAEGADCVFVAHMDGAMGMTPAEAPTEGDMQMVFTAAADVPFAAINPEMPEGPQMYVIGGDMTSGPFHALVKFPAGMTSPEHSHSATYSGAVVSGEMSHGGPDTMGVGSVWTEVGGNPHVTGCVSEEPCSFFVSMAGAFSMTPTAPAEAPEAPAAE